nr:immunoglobulin heavy chain junction region [Mus musculus]
ITARLLGTTLT